MSAFQFHIHRLRVTKVFEKEFLWWSRTAPLLIGFTMSGFAKRRQTIHITTDASFDGFGATMTFH